MEDIAHNGYSTSLLIVGSYTSGQAEQARRCSDELCSYGIPHHIYAYPHNPRRPEVAARAMADHPTRTIVLMDVDCQVNGPLNGMELRIDPGTDVAFYCDLQVRSGPFRIEPDNCVTAFSRVVVLQQRGAGAHIWMMRWRQLGSTDLALLQVMLTSHDLSWQQLDPVYAGLNRGDAPRNAVITYANTARWGQAKQRAVLA
jgi:hypothetical protein